MDKSQKFWDKVSAKYDRQALKKYDATYEQTISLSSNYLKKTDYAFDFACGTGITTIPLAQYVKRVDAIDISPRMIEIAEQKAQEKHIQNIRFLSTDIFNSVIEEGVYDAVMAFNVLYFFKDINSIMNRIYRLLKPKGMFLSATDCMGESNPAVRSIGTALSKTGLLPYMNNLKKADLKIMIKNAGFEMIFEKDLFDDPPNYYIAARRGS